MKKTGAALALFVSAILLFTWASAPAATDGFYRLYESPFSWDGTDANRRKAPTENYDYTYGDESNLTFALPWPFTFYGQPYSSINVDTNGNIWFTANGFAHSINLAQTGRGPVIAGWNDDLSSHYFGGVFVQHKTDPERVVVEWQTETYSEEGEYAPNHFEVVLYPDGRVRLDYTSFSGSLLGDFGSGLSQGDGTYSLSLSSAFGKVPSFSGRSFKVTRFAELSVSIDLAPDLSPVNVSTRTITGTMTGTEVSLIADSSVTFSAIIYPTPTTWSCTASGLAEGTNVVTVVTRDEAGNTGTARVEFMVDTLAPDAAIYQKPGATSNQSSGTISFGSSDESASFECKVDGESFVPCTSPHSYSNLADGGHTFTVRAKDPAGNLTATPAVYAWTIDTVAPFTTATPAAGIHDSPLRVTLGTDETATIYYTLDGSQPTTVSARYTAPISILDSCTLKFKAIDMAGNSETVRTTSYTMRNRVTLALTPLGTGTGAVTSNPSALACNTACSVNFNSGTPLTLTATNSEYSLFMGWGGDCLGKSPCSLVMDANKAVSATFDKDTARSVRLNSASISYYPSLLSAYLAAPASATIEAFGTEFRESPVFDQRKVISVNGGYDSGYSSDNGITQIKGKLVIRQGTVRVKKFAVR